jgi:D-glycero-D-manno-heptose 1,7-bisphosphate phosphatase
MVENKKAIFFDRDGVLNKNHYYKKFNQFEAPLYPKHLKIDKNISILKELQKKYLLFIITNQPAADKKKTSIKELVAIKKKFMKNLKNKKIYIKKYLQCLNDKSNKKNFCKNIKYCKFYKIKYPENLCKKPSNTLIEYCLKKYEINNKKSWFIGDRKTDLLAAKKSKLNTILVTNNNANKIESKYTIKSIKNLKNISEIWVN